MSVAHLREQLLARRVNGGANRADSEALLDELLHTCGEGTLAHALHYQGFATDRRADHAAALLIAHRAGWEACRADAPRAPGADPVVRRLIDGADVGDGRTLQVFNAWDEGYAAEIDRQMIAQGLTP